MRWSWLLAPLAIVCALGAEAHAAPAPIWSFEFDPSIAADPGATSKELSDNAAGLPPFPTAKMTQLTTAAGTTKLWLWPENAQALQRAGASGPGMMTWPTTPAICAKHAAFAMPALAPPNASGSCKSAADAIASALDLGACVDVEETERYVLDYEPATPDPNKTQVSIEGLVGLAGEALSHTQVPANLLPADFVTTLRTILGKLRHDALATRIANAKTARSSALAQANANGCFDAAAKTELASALSDLDKELDAANGWLAKIKSDGEAAWSHDNLCLAAHSRARVGLPYPSLTAEERRFIAFWLGGVYWRMRGGGLMPLGSTQNARLYFMKDPFTRIGELTGGQDGSDAAFQMYLAIFDGWGEWMDMGTTPGGGDKYYDLVGMTARGHRQVQGAADLLAKKGYDTVDLIAGGLGMGPCYFYALDPLKDFRYADQLTTPYGAFIEGFTAIGEFCSGASIALGFAQTLLEGTPTGQPPTVDLCSNKECGDDGCGGTCGTCSNGLACNAGHCGAPSSSSPPPAATPAATASPPSPSNDAPTGDAASSQSGCSVGSRSASTSTFAAWLLAATWLLRSGRGRRRRMPLASRTSR